MLDFEKIIATGEVVVQQISFNLQHISSVLETQIFDPFECCYYSSGSFYELESADDCSDEYTE
uniref:Non-structural protein 3b n=1 Tax=Infectious bronchitis virus CK/CH/LHLJ/04V TaxID=633557 RepID=C1KEZ9_9GAMC|nr:3b protein [Infectious bronchitis virus CK/CH/LHLJ/04V]ACO58556.1 3b protein [Infectious bronchitis virus CK/CH/LHLJ/04V]ACO58557.1 3b protein [Infectious bronchitis virus CK/CH/LHLJ/04V]ACO58558.1 3b protein [Infectious bronchitis virus CK/CH/LHLJ/04V]ACO58559.1 3b protein [Infectious bronchitis virus CK/CH/LHLJ/04V]